MGNIYRRKVCANCKKYRNLAWDVEKKICHDCLIEGLHNEN
jgi:hypothetical protein